MTQTAAGTKTLADKRTSLGSHPYLAESLVVGCGDGRGPQKSHRDHGSDSSILAARKLAQYDGGKRVPAISDGVRWAVEIMREIDEKFPAKSGLQKTTLG
jgi:hypothetical protein